MTYERGQLAEIQDPSGVWLPGVVLADVEVPGLLQQPPRRVLTVAVRSGRGGTTWTVTHKSPEQVRLPEGGQA
jgi:hypothetical protein